jgi:dihydropteroate synthase
MQTCDIGSLTVGGGAPVRLMGVINCSPESFFSGSYVAAGDIAARAGDLIDQGADIIDIGARSTAPHARPISVADEKERIGRALQEIEGFGVPISVDTMHPEVLEVCLRHGIDAVNDINGLANPEYAALVGDAGLPAIVMATIDRPGDAVGVGATMRALGQVLARAERAGIEGVIIDPAIGQWTAERTFEDDWSLCKQFSRFLEFDRPVLAAISRKSFIGDLLHNTPEDRLAGSIAVTYALLELGASVVRAHDAREIHDTIRVFEKIRGRL